ncbi:D-alanyl-D-alanine carboxypeptidase [Streptomyces sp. LE64]|uniref:D-alanyl-D-alanine carboxypeptidase n=1 Tax=Streptomyces sp. LE64 TaxID=3448653 RepID=UPI00404153A5
MTQLHTPKASRNQETGRLSFMGSVSRPRRPSCRAGGAGPAADASPAASTGRAGTFSSVSAFLSPTNRVTALLVTSALTLSLSLAAPAAHADEKPRNEKEQQKDAEGKKDRKEIPEPPSRMATVGGTRLGQPGTQVDLGSGAPVLPMKLSARSWIVADAESGDVLAAHNAHWPLAPASTLKMLFADALMPKFPKTLSHRVEPSDLAGIGPGSSLVGIKEEQTYTVHDLWRGVFLKSGNDAVRVLAAMNGGLPRTVADMQAHAEELQALDTKVVSPDGYDAPGQVSSAYDLTLIARSGLQKKDFREYSATLRAQFPGEAPKPKKGGKPKERPTFEIQNTNRLLGGAPGLKPYRGIAGVKNGNTTRAGTTFTGVAERDGKVLLVTVMNPSSDEPHAVYQETARLLDWGFASHGKVKPVGRLVPPRSVDTARGEQGPDSPARSGAGGSAGAAAQQGDGRKVAAEQPSGGMGTALAVIGGVLVVLAAGVFLINRRWPARGRR